MVKSIEDFRNFIHESDFSPAKLGKLNTLIFHEWHEEEARQQLPEDVVIFIASNQQNEAVKEAIYHALLPQELRSE